MQVSKKKVNSVLEKQLFAMLWQLVVDLKNPKEAEVVYLIYYPLQRLQRWPKTSGGVLAV